MHRISTRSTLAGAALARGLAAPAAAAPVTVTTDAGTSCTLRATQHTGAGLLSKPLPFSGAIDCRSTGAAKPEVHVTLANRGNVLALIIAAQAFGTRTEAARDPAVHEGDPSFRCDATAGDCTDSGNTTASPLLTYTTNFTSYITAPAGETFAELPAGCLGSGDSVVCSATATG